MRTKLLLVVIAFLIVLIISNADLTCDIVNSATCPTGFGTELLHMKSDAGSYNNAHAQQVNFTVPYTNTLCCNSTNQNLGNSSGTAFLNLSNATDAHVESPNGTAYIHPAYISGGTINPNCEIFTDGCPAGYTCLLSIASDGTDNTTNAHVAECDYYVSEVCCNSSSINSPPNQVELHEPFNGNATLFNRTITFQWLNTTDPDNNPLTYNIQVKQCGTSDPSTCNPDEEFDDTFTAEGEINITGISEGTNITEYISMFEVETDQNYTWRVRAYDDQVFGDWSENWTFYAPSSVILTLMDVDMDFGSLNVNDQNDTRNNDPYPFRIRNDGNVLTDVNLTVDTAEDWLWESFQTASSYFQYCIDNATAYSTYSEENASFNWSASATCPGWFNLPETNTSANIRQLNYSDLMDEARIDINITVPGDEGAGDKGSTIRITGWVAA
ncbi:MAG: fibronectin type III domain-containing protein [Nanoarchaeota archaeon]|nr:fibronectin type III domain-containing protein [Nanoarchaeota archaeon]